MQLCEQVRQFKKMALQMKVPVILTSPLGREVETRPNKRPVMRDLRDIGMLEDLADIILFIYRDEMYNPGSAERGMAEIILGKHRNGLPCMVQLAFRGEYCLFENFRSGNVSYAR
jgi:replicative DNA helicase